MEKEPHFNAVELENLESKLKNSGHFIEKIGLSESGPTQCETCMNEGDFEFYDEAWAVDGEPFCKKHKEGALKKMEQMDAESLKRKGEEKALTEDEHAMEKLLIETYGKKRHFLLEEDRIRESNPSISLGEVIRILYKEIEEEENLSEDERAVLKLILEKHGMEYGKGVQKYRASHPEMPLGEIIRKMYQEVEEWEKEKK